MDLAIRLQHEAQFTQNAWFITCTYDDENLPYGSSLRHDHISTFIRALRDKLRPQKIRFFGVGEYGGQLGRPHYHLILFGPDFPDKTETYTKPTLNTFSPEWIKMFGPGSGTKYYKSELLTSVWKKGHIQLTGISAATMQYVSKYHIEKVTGDKAESHYLSIVENSNTPIKTESEQARMSSNPGLGRKWIEKYWRDVYPHGYMQDRQGQKFAPPKYYDRWLENNHPDIYEKLKIERESNISLESNLDKKRHAVALIRQSQISIGKARKGQY